MKKIVRYISGLMLTGAMLMGTASCSPDDFQTIDPAGIPLVAGYENAVNVWVDQTTNYAHFEFTGAQGVYPVWIIDGKSYLASHNFTKFYRKAGDYTVEVKFGNANGVSDGSVMKTFHIDKTQMNGFGGFVYDSSFNLWKKATVAAPTFWYAPGWSEIAAPSYSFDGDAYTVSLPSATTDTWQAQMLLATDISTSADKHYDFSAIFTSSTAHPHVMVKLVDSTDDDVFYCAETIALQAGEPLCFWKSDMEGLDIANLKLVLDFGGNAENTEVIVENIVFKDHADDDGTVVPDLPSTPEPTWVAVDSEENLWSKAAFTNTFYYAPDWAQIADPKLTIDGSAYSVSLPTATTDQWQCQVTFNTDLTADTETEYDFRIVFNASQDIKGVTVKLVQTNETDADGNEVKHDQNFFFAENVDLTADSDIAFWQAKMKAPEAMHAISLVLDFGGNPAGTDVVIKDIILQKHKD